MASYGRMVEAGNNVFLNVPATTSLARNFKTCCYPLYFQMTPVLWGEPLKKKKRIDPAILKRREDRKRKRLEKGIKRLEKNARRLKPIEEAEISKNLLKEMNIRKRKPIQLSFEEAEYHATLQKEWCQYRTDLHADEMNMINRIMASQELALSELRNVSEELYQAAIQIDDKLIPFKTIGPTGTLPIEGYEPPNGAYVDTTRKWDKKIDLPVVKTQKKMRSR